MPLTRILLLALAALFCAGCSHDDMLQKFSSEEDRKAATRCIDTLRAGRIDEIQGRMEPSLRTPETREVLVRMQEMLPEGAPTAVKHVGAQLNVHDGVRESNITYQYSYGERHFLINCAMRTTGSERVIIGLNVHALDASLEELQRFEFTGKPALNYLVLAGALAAALVTVIALIRCFKEQGLRRKWLWVLFIIVGIGALSLNWNDGSWVFKPAMLLLFSASAVSYGYGGLEVSVALPLGAIVYLVRRYRNHRAAARSNDA